MIMLVAASLIALAQSRDSVVEQIQARISAEPGAQVGLAYIDLASGDTIFLNADTSFHAASTMKVPVMIELSPRQHRILQNGSGLVDGEPVRLDRRRLPLLAGHGFRQ